MSSYCNREGCPFASAIQKLQSQDVTALASGDYRLTNIEALAMTAAIRRRNNSNLDEVCDKPLPGGFSCGGTLREMIQADAS